MIKEANVSKTLLFIILMSSALVTASPHCKDAEGFDAEFKSELDNQSLQDLFNDSRYIIGQGNNVVVKPIPWILENGKKIEVAVKKINLWDEYDVEQVDNEIANLIKFKDNQYVVQSFGCMEMSVKEEAIIDANGQLKILKNEQKIVFIVLEKLFGDFKESIQYFAPFRRLKSLSLVKKMELSLQIAEGLKSMHDKGLVHADLKPTNMMATDENLSKVKIIDLGLSTKIGSPFTTSTTLYMDLDAWNTEAIKTSFDTHSFGLTIVGIEFGSNSFKGSIMPLFISHNKQFCEERRANVQKVLDKALEWRKDPESIIDDSFAKILMDCIEIDASKRPSDEDLIKRLKDVIEETKRITAIRESKRGSLPAGSQKIVNPIAAAEVVNAVQKSLTASKQPVENSKGALNILKTLNTKVVTDTGIEENKRSPFIYILIGIVLLGLLVPVGYFLCFKRKPELVGSE